MAFTLRPFAISASVQRQSVRPPSIGTATEGRINLRASQRLSVLNETPIFAAAVCVLEVDWQTAAEEARLKAVRRIAREYEHGTLGRVRRIEFRE